MNIIQIAAPLEACARANEHLANAESALRKAIAALIGVGGQEEIIDQLQAMHAELADIIPKTKP